MSVPCEHGCHVIWAGSPLVWHFSDIPVVCLEPEDALLLHRSCDNDECSNECWGGE